MKNISRIWQTSRRAFDYGEKTLVMGILNVTPDSFSDGGKFASLASAIRQAEKLIEEGADILDIGGESTRPNSQRVSADEEIRRVVPAIEEIKRRFDVAISIDTTKSKVARAAVEMGAEIINDISGLRFDEEIAAVAAGTKTGLILMHSSGEFETLHSPKFVEQILPEVVTNLRQSVTKAAGFGVNINRIALDIGIGFGKALSQNLELLAKIDEICHNFADFPILIGASRKSFIGKVLNDAPAPERLYGSLTSAAIAVFGGANIVRVHDVRATIETVRVAEAIRNKRNRQDEADNL